MPNVLGWTTLPVVRGFGWLGIIWFGVAILLSAQIGYTQTVFPSTTSNVVGMGVDLKRGSFTYSNADISVGSGAAPQSLTLVRTHSSEFPTYAGTFGLGTTTNFDIKIYETTEAGSTVAVVLTGFQAQKYTLTGSTYVPQAGDGSTLSKTLAPGTLTYYYQWTGRNGDSAVLVPGTPCTTSFGTCYYAASFVSPSAGGYRLFYDYGAGRLRLRSVISDHGRALFFNYPSTSEWKASSVTAANLASTYCGAYCTTTAGLPSVNYAYTGNVLTSKADTLGKQSGYIYDTSNRLQKIRLASNPTMDFLTTNYDATGRVASQVWNGKTWTYSFTLSGTEITQAVVTDPLSGQTTTHFGSLPAPDSIKDASNNITALQYDGFNRLHIRTLPSGIVQQYDYDGRGNIATVTATPNAVISPAPPSRAVTFDFPVNCINQVICNLPASVTNSKGTTSLSYDATSGNVTKITSPPPTTGAAQAETRYEYATRQAYIKDSSGNPTIQIANSGGSAGNQILRTVPVLTKIARCSASAPASCPGASDEIVSTFDYGPTTGLNNLDLVGSKEDATGAALVSSFLYDVVGNVAKITGPYPGGGDVTNNVYDSERRVTQVTSPDPDGAGPLAAPVSIIGYDDDGRVVRNAEQRDTAWLVSCVRYSNSGLASREWGPAETSASTTCPAEADPVFVVDYAYDDAGRRSTTTQLLTAAQGGNRVTATDYYANGWVNRVRTAVGTSVAANYQTFTYNGDGVPTTAKDARGNLTTYEYNGFDELIKLRYPDVANGAVSSTTDFEAFAYDANGNITSHTQRGGAVIAYQYDALDRLKLKDVPEADRDVSYTYDLHDRPLAATLPGGNATLSVSWTYDKLDRTTSEAVLGRTTVYSYEPAGAWGRVQWPGSVLTVQRNYDVLGRMQTVAQVSGPTLATYTYDQLSRRTNTANGNATSASYGYDARSKLGSLSYSIGGAGYPVAFSYGYNQAGQLSGRTRDQDTYAWTRNYNVTRTYDPNPLDQYARAGARNMTYDARGNLASHNGYVYGHDSENRLVSVSGITSATLTYDAVDRLVRTSSGGTSTDLIYDGDALIAEYIPSTSTVLRRYVQGAGVDEPLLWYEGSGLADPRWLHADERGSVISGSTSAGTGLFINSYGPFGEQGMSQTGRFGYTGQALIPEISLYNYKARIYSPALGRFLETDPIGTQDDANLYAYTGNDPINLTDPSGLDAGFGLALPALDLGFIGAPCSLCNAIASGFNGGDIVVTGLRQRPSWLSLDTVHFALDAASFAPSFIGSGFSAIDAGIYAFQGDRVGAGIALAAAGAGLVSDAGAAKLALRLGRAASADSKLLRSGEQLFYRRGPYDTLNALRTQAAAAEKSNFGHGISISLSRVAREGQVVRCATRCSIETAGFRIQQTGSDLNHYTLQLSKPISPDVARVINDLFKAVP